jgi:hypothetical protein
MYLGDQVPACSGLNAGDVICEVCAAHEQGALDGNEARLLRVDAWHTSASMGDEWWDCHSSSRQQVKATISTSKHGAARQTVAAARPWCSFMLHTKHAHIRKMMPSRFRNVASTATRGRLAERLPGLTSRSTASRFCSLAAARSSVRSTLAPAAPPAINTSCSAKWALALCRR